MTEPNHWLARAARSLRPDVAIPVGIEISANTPEAWRQVALIFQMSPMELAASVAAAFGLKAGRLDAFQPSQPSLLPERLCRELGMVQLWANERTACVAISDPRMSEEQRSRLRFTLGRPCEWVVLPPDDIDTCLARSAAASGVHRSPRGHLIDLLSTESPGDDAPIVKLACALLRKAIDSRASDVHIHPFVGGGAVRFRIDGRLKRITTLPIETLSGLSRYFKAQAGLEPNPLKPQDGRLRLAYGRREIDVRLSVLPAYDGDRIVCRLLDQSRNFSLQQSRFSIADQQTLRRLTDHSAGIVLLTGPTGSGKTSTLYALLAELNSVDVNIMTIEDPVEYVLPGVSQVQVNEKQGLSFADTLRSILRQDPDIVLVGEIRDGETAHIAMQAALTGHLVLSTLHTNDALGALPRLLDLGLDASILGDALLGVISQRLVRQLCESCRQPTQAPHLASETEFHRLTGEYPAYRPGSCQACSYTGFRGRLPIIESLEVSPPLRQAIISGERRLHELGVIAGGSRRSMAASAKDWIVSGHTTAAEIQQVIGMGFWRELAAEHGVAPESLSANLVQESAVGTRLKVLVLSQDTVLCDELADGLSYAVQRVDGAEAADAHLRTHNDAVAMVIDSRCKDAAPEPWLIGLRTQLAWAGLPALFVTRPDESALKELLTQFSASHVDWEAGQPLDLNAALTQLMQGRY